MLDACFAHCVCALATAAAMPSPEPHLLPEGLEGDVILPRWPAPAGVHALCSTRQGGVSERSWDSLNLGTHVGDDATSVARNRAIWAQRLQARPVFLQQVHGVDVLPLDAHTPDGAEADACVTAQPGLACTMMVADCLPVLLCDARGGAHARVGAAHAGWRGLAGVSSAEGTGVLEALGAHFDPAHTLAWLGPCIGPAAFEVGAEVKAAFEQADAGASALFSPMARREDSADSAGGANASDKWLANLPALARRRLAALGITRVYGNDGSQAWCTVANASLFFSHRRDRVSGRLAASIWLS